MLLSAQDAVGIPLRYARAGRNLVHAIMAGRAPCVELAHYPSHDVVDAQHGSRMYYHAHGSRRKPADEHGHFHVFCHGKLPGDFTHLVGISMSPQGQPIRLFTTNRWVTGETWRSSTGMDATLDGFQVRTQGRLAPVARWVTAMVHLYRPQIGQLHQKRDAVMARRSANTGWETLFEDRRLDVVTQRRISLVQKIQQLGC